MGAVPNDLDPKVADLIRFKVRKLIGNFGFTRSDREDLEQDLTVYVIAGMKTHDPTRSSACTYADRIVTTKIATIIEKATAKKRDRRKERDLEEATERLEVDDPEQRDLQLDVRDAIARLPEDLRPVARMLMELTEAEVIRKTGYSREKVRGMRRRIAQHLKEMGLSPESGE